MSASLQKDRTASDFCEEKVTSSGPGYGDYGVRRRRSCNPRILESVVSITTIMRIPIKPITPRKIKLKGHTTKRKCYTGEVLIGLSCYQGEPLLLRFCCCCCCCCIIRACCCCIIIIRCCIIIICCCCGDIIGIPPTIIFPRPIIIFPPICGDMLI